VTVLVDSPPLQGELGEQWWRDAGAQFNASEQQIRFAVAKFAGMSNAGAARSAGYGGEESSIRQSGYKAFRTTAVQNMLAFAAAESKGGVSGDVDSAESRRILSKLARGSDPSIRIRAIEMINKLDVAERAVRMPTRTPAQISAEIIAMSPEYAPIMLADLHFRKAGSIFGLALLPELAPVLARNFPKAWLEFRKAVKIPERLAELDRLANGSATAIRDLVQQQLATLQDDTSEFSEAADA
jgi:hypothetical protein